MAYKAERLVQVTHCHHCTSWRELMSLRVDPAIDWGASLKAYHGWNSLWGHQSGDKIQVVRLGDICCPRCPYCAHSTW